MKTIALIISLSGLFFYPARAQVADLNSFYQPGTIWATFSLEKRQLPSSSVTHPRNYEIGHDSIVNGQTVHLLNFEDGVTRKGIGAIRVDSQKVYFTNLSADSIYVRWPYGTWGGDKDYLNSPATIFGPNTEHLLYDYNIRLGDTLHWRPGYLGNTPGYQIITKIDSVVADGIYLRRFHFYYVGASPNALGQEYWIEGMGSNLGFLGSYDTPWGTFGSPNIEAFTRTSRYCSPDHHYNFGMRDSSLYDGNCRIIPLGVKFTPATTAQVSVFPNPSGSDEIHIKTEGGSGLAEITIYDLYGRQVLHSLPVPGSVSGVIHAALAPSVYFINIVLGNHAVVTKRYTRL